MLNEAEEEVPVGCWEQCACITQEKRLHFVIRSVRPTKEGANAAEVVVGTLA